MNRPLCLTALAPLSLALAACSASSDAPAPEPTAAPAAAATTTTAAPTPSVTLTERTDLTVFIEEPEPLSVFANDQLVCAPHSEVGDYFERPDAPRVQLLDADGEILATQEVTGTGPVLGGVCTIFVKFLDIPVSESYRVVFSGEDGDGAPYQHEGVTELDQGKFDDGYTQGYTFELS